MGAWRTAGEEWVMSPSFQKKGVELESLGRSRSSPLVPRWHEAVFLGLSGPPQPSPSWSSTSQPRTYQMICLAHSRLSTLGVPVAATPICARKPVHHEELMLR